MPTLLDRTISRAVRGTNPQTKARIRALASVRWALATADGHFVAIDDRARATLVRDLSLAVIYDGRDNEILKARFFEALLKVQLTIVLLDC